MKKIRLSTEFKSNLSQIILNCVLTDYVNPLDFYLIDVKNEKIYSQMSIIKPENLIPLGDLIDHDELCVLEILEYKQDRINYCMGAVIVDIVLLF